MVASMDDPESSLAHCTIVRPSNYLDRMFYLQHRLGAQSNILVSAHYTLADPSTGQNVLSREAVYAAIRSVITTYPELSIVAIQQPLEKKGHHLLRLAALHEIDIETCVEFHDDEPPKASSEAIERIHNQWDWTDDKFNPRQPWWKVVVLGRQEVIFVFHHLVCDGRFGQIFHREFLAAIDSFDEHDKPPSHIIKIDTERVRLDKEVEEFWISSISVLNVIHIFLSFILLRLFFGNKLLFTGLPNAKPHGKSVTVDAGPDERTTTRVVSLSISAPRMRRILSACREHNTTFTPLLSVFTLGTLVCDFYPNAKVAISNCALDARSVYPQRNEEAKSGRLLQSASGHAKFTWLSRYREVFGCSGSGDKGKSHINGQKAGIDANGAWALVQEYHAHIATSLEKKGSKILKMFRAANSVSNDLEGMLSSNFPALGIHLNNSLQVSNLGPFKLSEQGKRWKIDDMSFSACCINGNISYPVSTNVAGVEGGSTVIIVSFEDGVVSEDMVSKMMEATVERIESIL